MVALETEQSYFHFLILCDHLESFICVSVFSAVK